MEEPRIGVYICECGINISATVDVPAVVEMAAALPGVVIAREHKYMCSEPGQEMIQDDIRDLGLKTASEKGASFLLSLVPPRAPYPTSVSLVLSRQEIAGMLGLTVETVSRTIAEFKRTGVIQTPHKQILILDIARLRTLAGSSAKLDEDNKDENNKKVIPIN